MKKTLFFAVAMLSVGNMLQAQSRLTTHSVYDVNGKDGVTVADATQVISRAIETIKEDPQVAEVSQLNLLLESIDSKLQMIQDKLFGKYDTNNVMTNGHEYVDLGIVDENGRPVYWATCNLGADSESQYGKYFAWGSIYGYTDTDEYLNTGVTMTQEQLYSWSDYCFAFGEYDLAKYNNDENYGSIFDHKYVLDSEDDAAAELWGGSWRMPTNDEFQSLINECTWTWELNGFRVTSNKNGSSIFLRAGGEIDEGYCHNNDEYGFYWSNAVSDPTFYASCLYFTSEGTIDLNGQPRYAGLPIRPVCSPAE